MVERFKLISGILLLLFALLGGLLFFLESFGFQRHDFDSRYLSDIWGNAQTSSNAPIFLGLCAIAGAYLLSHTKPKEKSEPKSENKLQD